MKTFQVTLSETLSVTRSVKAANAEEATKIVNAMVGHPLSYEDYSNYQKKCIEVDETLPNTVPFVVERNGRWEDTAD